MTAEPERDEAKVDDLDVDEEEADAVKGGRIGDPCDGGE